MKTEGAGYGVGRSVHRKEDDRYLRGKGEFVGDIRLAGMRELAFVRSPLAHAKILTVRKPAGFEKNVFVASDLVGVKPIVANSGLPGFKPSAQPILADEKVRHVGEAIAVCVAATRAEAEDLAAAVEVDFEELPAIVDMLAARAPGSPLVHEQWGDNVFLESRVEADLSEIKKTAPVVVRRSLRTARQCMSPMEGRGIVAVYDRRLDQIVLHTATQMPHIIRTGLAGCLGVSEENVRIVAPDVGGGFGYKGMLLSEEVCAAFLAKHLGHPVRWLEDRREQLAGNANCREHHYDITAYADKDGRLIALDAAATVDTGAYSIYPFSACLESAQVASILPGPYKFDAYRCITWSSATNKPGIVPYRGVARAGVCYAMETVIDAIAHAVGKEPYEVRLRNLVQPEEMPFDNITNKHFDSGDYPECLRRVVEAIDLPAVRQKQKETANSSVRIGVGFSIFCEQGAHGTSVYYGWGIPMVPGFEQAVARLTPDGGLELRVGIQSHGQGLETTLAQIGHEVLGIPLERIRVVHGDTAVTPYSTGTWGSRCAVMAGGAVATACRELGDRIARIGAHLLQVPADKVQVKAGLVSTGIASVRIEEVARTWYLRPQELPKDVNTGGLEVTSGYKTVRDTGTFSYAAHAVVVSVDTEMGDVKILDYALCEDGGVLINPMIVDGQVCGGVAQGIGTALYEEMPFDDHGQPLATTLADYMLPGATEVPMLRVDHMETPSPYSAFGQKGIGEGGAIGPPAAIANAVNDALHPLGVEINQLPITPHRILEAIAASRKRAAA
ncbi:xanthine dehydrogenase family protein molybdopterin-binding subunit [Pseudorhodoplanes sinuspersici]|uniref:Carbon monoxide dehydrogenase n=1 Tax=Pseudorhodoplanes sinuspersici TaxID=1235591 RepID=A0A1W6ZKP7_9HYPH|nr:xanthine dehydrogenase family protein molybdopterin-binding subunit [Pseudorhodoplanes sinuspersici]ARP97710.1 carbon monoxide dehydrogenase [Pseudorhodoplanes sinuspersici]RKE68571.1 xanthine dehydrogenase molybdenum binding subunit apoprotein [Pseudorhodoplanes sinuspersici]